MKRTLVRALVIAAIAAGGTAVAVTPAHASDLGGPICILNQNTWLRWAPWSFVIRTLSAGRGFRVQGGQSDGYETWYYGHGAEAPEQDGWIPATNCNF
jgi:hypothetical protein